MKLGDTILDKRRELNDAESAIYAQYFEAEQAFVDAVKKDAKVLFFRERPDLWRLGDEQRIIDTTNFPTHKVRAQFDRMQAAFDELDALGLNSTRIALPKVLTPAGLEPLTSLDMLSGTDVNYISVNKSAAFSGGYYSAKALKKASIDRTRIEALLDAMEVTESGSLELKELKEEEEAVSAPIMTRALKVEGIRAKLIIRSGCKFQFTGAFPSASVRFTVQRTVFCSGGLTKLIEPIPRKKRNPFSVIYGKRYVVYVHDEDFEQAEKLLEAWGNVLSNFDAYRAVIETVDTYQEPQDTPR